MTEEQEQFDFNKLCDFDSKELKASSRAHITNLCQSVYGKSPKDLENDEVLDLVCMDLATFPQQLTVSAGATRRTEVQYCSNNYHLSEQLDISMATDYVKETLNKCATGEEIIDRYISARTTLFKLIEVKVSNTEEFLRSLIRDMETTDNMQPQGRYK